VRSDPLSRGRWGSSPLAWESLGSNTGPDYATIAYDAASGDRLWVARYDGPGHTNDSAYGLAVSPDGTRLYVTGGSATIANHSDDYATVAYDTATGKRLWVARYDGPGPERSCS